MSSTELIEWLLAEGGPAIRCRTALELAGSRGEAENEALCNAVLQTEKTRWLLDQIDAFGPLTHVDIRVLNALHGSKPTCLENLIPRLLERGLRAGVGVFDEKMERFRQYVDNPLVSRVLDGTHPPTIEEGRALFIATVMAAYFLRGGYEYEEIIHFVLRRVELCSRVAAEQDYAIHLNEAELAGLPKLWQGKPIIRPELDPLGGRKPLPLIHYLYGMASLPARVQTEPVREGLKAIIAYVTDARYRAFPPGYGYLWPESNRRTCYHCGWDIDLPDLDAANTYQQRKIVQRLELLARLPPARQSAWFGQGLKLLESFRTERGTYRFPATYLAEQRSGYYVGGEYMGLEDTPRRDARVLELESTFRMLLIRNSMG